MQKSNIKLIKALPACLPEIESLVKKWLLKCNFLLYKSIKQKIAEQAEQIVFSYSVRNA